MSYSIVMLNTALLLCGWTCKIHEKKNNVFVLTLLFSAYALQ